MLKILNVMTLEAVDAFLRTSEPVALQASELAATVGASFLCSAGGAFALITGAAGLLGCFVCGIAAFATGVAVYGLC